MAGKSARGRSSSTSMSRPFARSPTAAGSVDCPVRWARAPLTSRIRAASGDGEFGSIRRNQLPTTSSAVSGVPSGNREALAKVEDHLPAVDSDVPAGRKGRLELEGGVVHRQGLVGAAAVTAAVVMSPWPADRMSRARRRGCGPRRGPRPGSEGRRAAGEEPEGEHHEGDEDGPMAHGQRIREGPASHRRGNDAGRGAPLRKRETRPVVRLRPVMRLRDTLRRDVVPVEPLTPGRVRDVLLRADRLPVRPRRQSAQFSAGSRPARAAVSRARGVPRPEHHRRRVTCGTRASTRAVEDPMLVRPASRSPSSPGRDRGRLRGGLPRR